MRRRWGARHPALVDLQPPPARAPAAAPSSTPRRTLVPLVYFTLIGAIVPNAKDEVRKVLRYVMWKFCCLIINVGCSRGRLHSCLLWRVVTKK